MSRRLINAGHIRDRYDAIKWVASRADCTDFQHHEGISLLLFIELLMETLPSIETACKSEVRPCVRTCVRVCVSVCVRACMRVLICGLLEN